LDKSHICYVMYQALSSHHWYFVAEKYSPRKRSTDLTAFAALDLLSRLKRIIVYSSKFFRTSSTLLNTAIDCQKYISEVARARIWDTIWCWEVRYRKFRGRAANEIFNDICLVLAFIDLLQLE
jgi:hypothetical protein